MFNVNSVCLHYEVRHITTLAEKTPYIIRIGEYTATTDNNKTQKLKPPYKYLTVLSDKPIPL